MTQATITVEQAARLLGIGRTLAYEHARQGQLAGVKVLAVGGRHVVPAAPMAEALGVTREELADLVD